MFIYVVLNEEKPFLYPPLALEGLKPQTIGYDESTSKYFNYDKLSPIQSIFGGQYAAFPNPGSKVYLRYEIPDGGFSIDDLTILVWYNSGTSVAINDPLVQLRAYSSGMDSKQAML